MAVLMQSQNYLFSREGFLSNVWGVVSNATEHFIPTVTQVQSVQVFLFPPEPFNFSAQWTKKIELQSTIVVFQLFTQT